MQDFFLNHPNNKITPTISTEILTNSSSMIFHSNLKDYNCPPLVSLKSLAKELNINNLFVKDESERFGLNAFKVLGASYAVNHLLNNESNITTFCTATDGNHGKALAWSSMMYNRKCVVYVPRNTSKLRIKGISSYGAKVEILDLIKNPILVEIVDENNKDNNNKLHPNKPNSPINSIISECA